MAQSRGFSIGWMFVSYFMITGGLVLVFGLAGLLKIEAAFVGWVAGFVGAGFGGFIAGRASPGKTILEPALGGVMLMVSFIGLIALVPGVRQLWRLTDDSATLYAALYGLVLGAGGLVGGVLGERSTPDGGQSDSPIRWMGVSALINAGLFFFLFMVLAILLLRHAADGGSIGDDAGGGLMILVLALTALLGGAITQAIAPNRMFLASGAGFLMLMFAMFGLAASAAPRGGQMGQAFGGIMIVGLIGLGIGAVGAAIAWSIVKDRKNQPTDVGQVFE